MLGSDKGERLYIKHLLRHPPMTQSVAIVHTTDGLRSLTVFIDIARAPHVAPRPLGHYITVTLCRLYSEGDRTMVFTN